ncbi:UDP-3-O-acyl-N-acetylglucosamine deacetylase [Cochlodiniinecator piscidefendens]|uniref:UDP-3-O-acyl-N-acetylglucosamine deacetylase n=1 Tax=Cochlodiniinecator piscidefendens TaxID=2715756 RepID=UPI00140DD5A9|nr:UDP-3-O-acyl-N-acetylglucosamine deacetylase [Cochlodiniinecator piscidefendens]
MANHLQKTVSSAIRLKGVGLHSGQPADVVIAPAKENSGIVFERADVEPGTGIVQANWANVKTSPLTTILVNDLGVSVSSVEHLLAALAGCDVDNARISITGPEVPIMEGSAAPFVRAILGAGSRIQNSAKRVIRVLQAVEVSTEIASARLEPNDGLEIGFSIEFEDAAIGKQSKMLNMANGNFVRELADSRTFCRQADLDAMRKNGLALGGTLENIVVVDGEEVISPNGLRHNDEAVRHKMLDALGDLSLAGHSLRGRYIGRRGGHALTHNLLRALFANPQNYQIEELQQEKETSSLSELDSQGLVPERQPAPLEVEIFNQRLIKAVRSEPALSDAQQELRARMGWDMLVDFSTGFESSLSLGNYRPLSSAMGLLSRALGTAYEEMNEVGVGIASKRLEALANDSEFNRELPSGAATELKELSVAVSTFTMRFPKWLLYLEDAESGSEEIEITQEIISSLASISNTLNESEEVSRDVQVEFNRQVDELEENPQSELLAVGLLASTREILRELSDNAMISWRLYKEELAEKGASAKRVTIGEVNEIGKITPTELRKAGLWGCLGVTWDIMVFNGSGLLTLAAKFPEKFGWIKGVLSFFGIN